MLHKFLNIICNNVYGDPIIQHRMSLNDRKCYCGMLDYFPTSQCVHAQEKKKKKVPADISVQIDHFWHPWKVSCQLELKPEGHLCTIQICTSVVVVDEWEEKQRNGKARLRKGTVENKVLGATVTLLAASPMATRLVSISPWYAGWLSAPVC